MPLRAYAADWRDFTAWCAGQWRQALPAPPETVALYFTAAAETRKVSTLTERAAAISHAHQLAGFDSPTQHIAVAQPHGQNQPAKGTAQTGKRPVEHRGPAHRAIVRLGFAGRSRVRNGSASTSLTSNSGETAWWSGCGAPNRPRGTGVGIPYGSHPATCPVRAVQERMALLKEGNGRSFGRQPRPAHPCRRLTTQSVALVVKRLAGRVELEAAQFAGHSLRAGLATAAATGRLASAYILLPSRTLASLVPFRAEPA